MFFLYKKLLMMTIIVYQYDRFFKSNRNFTTSYILKIPGFKAIENFCSFEKDILLIYTR